MRVCFRLAARGGGWGCSDDEAASTVPAHAAAAAPRAACVGPQDEAREVSGGAPPEAGLAYLAAHCRRAAVVTLAERGCLVRERGGGATIVQPACKGVQAVDSTGAGDLFAAGFLYALLRGYPLGRCAEVGCIAGGAVVQALGAEMTPATWHWLHARSAACCVRPRAAGSPSAASRARTWRGMVR